jgi:hypothetical protein
VGRITGYGGGVALAALVLATSAAHGQSLTTTTTTTTTTTRGVLPAAPPPAAEAPTRLYERTAFTIPKHTLALGVLAFDYGFAEGASVGSDPPAWALRAVSSVIVPNLHVKFQVFRRDPVWIALQGAAYYADISSNVSGQMLVTPLSLWASFKVTDRFFLHAEGTYVYVHAFGTGNVTRAELQGAAATQTVQTQLMAQLQLTRVVSLTALGRYQLYTGGVAFSGSGALDDFTTASVQGRLELPVAHPWEAIGGVALLWKHFHLILGAGYGYYFVPGIDVANTRRTFVPDAELAVLF